MSKRLLPGRESQAILRHLQPNPTINQKSQAQGMTFEKKNHITILNLHIEREGNAVEQILKRFFTQFNPRPVGQVAEDLYHPCRGFYEAPHPLKCP